MGFVVAGLLIVARAFTQNVSARAGFSWPRAALRGRGPPRILEPDSAGRERARCAHMGRIGRTCFLVLVILEMLW
jgi:hypothetical protein